MMYTCGYWKEGTRDARGGAAQQDRARLPQAAAPAGRGGGRHRLRLRRLHVPRRRAFGAQGHRHQHHDRAGRDGARRDRAPRPRRRARRGRGRLPRRRPRSTTRWCRSACSSTPGATSSTKWCARTPTSSSPAASACCTSSATSGVAETEFFIRKHVFPGRLDPEPRRRRSPRWSAPGSRSSTSRTCAATTRSRSTPGPSASSATGSASTRSIRRASTSASAASGARTCYGCAEMFRSPRGDTHLFQIVFSKGNITRDNYPMSRAFLYEDADARPQPRSHARDRCRAPMSAAPPRSGSARGVVRDARGAGPSASPRTRRTCFASARAAPRRRLDVRAIRHVLAVDPRRGLRRRRGHGDLRGAGRRDACRAA